MWVITAVEIPIKFMSIEVRRNERNDNLEWDETSDESFERRRRATWSYAHFFRRQQRSGDLSKFGAYHKLRGWVRRSFDTPKAWGLLWNVICEMLAAEEPLDSKVIWGRETLSTSEVVRYLITWDEEMKGPTFREDMARAMENEELSERSKNDVVAFFALVEQFL